MFGNLGPDIMVTGDKGPTSEAPDVHKSFGHLPVSRIYVPASDLQIVRICVFEPLTVDKPNLLLIRVARQSKA